MEHNNDGRCPRANETSESGFGLEFQMVSEETVEQKILAETDPAKREILYRIYSGMSVVSDDAYLRILGVWCLSTLLRLCLRL